MTDAIMRLVMPHDDRFYDQVIANHRGAVEVVEAGSHVGQSVAICCAGPSLADQPLEGAFDQVWAVNSALPYLMDRGVPVTHACTVDQGPAMMMDREFGRAFDVDYLLASCVYPELVQILRKAGRHIRYFHSYLGVTPPPDWVERPGFGHYEEWLYRKLYPTSICVGAGLNSGPRALSVAIGMGFSRIVVYGADCACAPGAPSIPAPPGTPAYAAWIRGLRMYADGRSPADCYHDAESLAEGEIDGRLWHTRPDMVISAQHLLQLQTMEPEGRITFVGDTLVNAIRGQDQAFMARLPILNNVLGQVEHMDSLNEVLV